MTNIFSKSSYFSHNFKKSIEYPKEITPNILQKSTNLSQSVNLKNSPLKTFHKMYRSMRVTKFKQNNVVSSTPIIQKACILDNSLLSSPILSTQDPFNLFGTSRFMRDLSIYSDASNDSRNSDYIENMEKITIL